MENELIFYKGICEQQTKKIGELQHNIKKHTVETKEDIQCWSDSLDDSLQNYDLLKEENNKLKEQIEEIKKFEDRYQLERLALLMKITSLKGVPEGVALRPQDEHYKSSNSAMFGLDIIN